MRIAAPTSRLLPERQASQGRSGARKAKTGQSKARLSDRGLPQSPIGGGAVS
jgi:hypothetical protein